MLPWHARHFDTWHLLPLAGILRSDIYEHVVEEIEIVHRGERFAIFLCGVCKVRFGVWGCDHGEVAAEGGFDFLVEVVAAGKGG